MATAKAHGSSQTAEVRNVVVHEAATVARVVTTIRARPFDGSMGDRDALTARGRRSSRRTSSSTLLLRRRRTSSPKVLRGRSLAGREHSVKQMVGRIVYDRRA